MPHTRITLLVRGEKKTIVGLFGIPSGLKQLDWLVLIKSTHFQLVVQSQYDGYIKRVAYSEWGGRGRCS